MIQLPPQNLRMEHWIVDPAMLVFTPGTQTNLRLMDTVLEMHNGYQVLKHYYVAMEVTP